MQELHVDNGVSKAAPAKPVSRRTALLVVALFAVVLLGTLTLLTTKTGQRISGLRIASLASLASTDSNTGDKPVAPVINCIKAPCPGDATPTAIRYEVTSPAKGEAWQTGSKYQIRWKVDPNPTFAASKVNIVLQPHPACMDEVPACQVRLTTPALPIVTNEDNDGLYEWVVPANLPDGYIFENRIEVYVNNNPVAMVSATFTIVKGPTVPASGFTVTAPVSSDRWRVGQQYTVGWDAAPLILGSGKVQINLSSTDLRQ